MKQLETRTKFLNRLSLSLVALGLLCLSPGWGEAPEDSGAVDAFRRLVFMINLDPVPWQQVQGEVGTIETWLQGVSPEAGAAYGELTSDVFAKLRREASISIPTQTMQRIARKTLVEQTSVALATELLARLDGPVETAAGAASVRSLWRVFEPETAWADPSTATRLGERFEALDDPANRIFAVGEIRDYVTANFVESFRVKFHGALRPLPTSAMEKQPGPVPYTTLPPGTVLNPGATAALAALEGEYEGKLRSQMTSYERGLVAFHDPSIFGEPGRSLGMSCGSCHLGALPNAQFFIPGLSDRGGNADVTNNYFAKIGNNKAFDPLDIPALSGIRHTAPHGRNARFENLGQVVRNVIVLEFAGSEPSRDLIDDIVAFMESFDFPANAHLTSDGSLVDGVPPEAMRGEAVFRRPFEQMEGRSCASCHLPGDYFLDRQKHNIGSIPPGSPYAPDGALDTPTLLGSADSAPYFHNGHLPTLRSVVEWFDGKFGLALTGEEVSDLTAYLELVGADTASETAAAGSAAR